MRRRLIALTECRVDGTVSSQPASMISRGRLIHDAAQVRVSLRRFARTFLRE